MAPYIDRKAHVQLDPTARAYVLRRTPDEIAGAVLGALYPKYQIDEVHQLALCNIIGQSFECINGTLDDGSVSSSAPIAILKPSPQGQTTKQRYAGYHSSRRSSSAVVNHYSRTKSLINKKPRGGFGAPKSVNGAFYFHHTDPTFMKTYTDVDLSQYEKVPKPQGNGSFHRAGVDMSPSKARKDRMDRAMLQQRASSVSLASTMPKIVISTEGDAPNNIAQDATEVKEECESDVDIDAAGNYVRSDKVAELLSALSHAAPVQIKTEEDDSAIDMDGIPMDLTKSFPKVENSNNVSVSHGTTMNTTQSFYQADESDDESDINDTSMDVTQPLIKKKVSDNVSVTHGSTMNFTQSFYQASDSDSASQPELNMNDSQDSPPQDAIFTQPPPSASGTQLSDTTESPEPNDANKTPEIKKPDPVRLKLNLKQPRRSSRIAKQTPSASASTTSSSSASPAPSMASSLGKRARREDEENGEPSKRSKMT